MATLRVGFIGTGRNTRTIGTPDGFFMAYFHWRALKKLPDLEFAACADIVKENAEAFAKETGTKKVYTDYREMLKNEKLDLVTIATWTHLHAEMVIAAAKAGVKAIHCEKPIAHTWKDAREVVRTAKECGCRLTINHQRRYGDQFQKLLEVLKSGKIGDLKRMEGCCPNLWDWGDHFCDMFQMFNDETPGKWALGQIDFRSGSKWFGMYVEDRGIWHIGYENGVEGIFITGPDEKTRPGLRLIGTKGYAEYHWQQPMVRVLSDSVKGWELFETGDGGWEDPSYWEVTFFNRIMADVVDAFRTGRPTRVDAELALRGHEVAFACYESVRRRGKVEMPLTIEDNPFEDMVKTGALGARKEKK